MFENAYNFILSMGFTTIAIGVFSLGLGLFFSGISFMIWAIRMADKQLTKFHQQSKK